MVYMYTQTTVVYILTRRKVVVYTSAKRKTMQCCTYILTMGKVVVYWWQNHCIIATTQVLVSLTQPRRSACSKAQTPSSKKLPCYTPLPGSRQISQMCSMVWQLINWKGESSTSWE